MPKLFIIIMRSCESRVLVLSDPCVHARSRFSCFLFPPRVNGSVFYLSVNIKYSNATGCSDNRITYAPVELLLLLAVKTHIANGTRRTAFDVMNVTRTRRSRLGENFAEPGPTDVGRPSGSVGKSFTDLSARKSRSAGRESVGESNIFPREHEFQ